MTTETAIMKNPVEGDSMQISNIVLSARGLRKAFGGQVVLDDISLDLRQGEVVLLRGENGSGKTTLLNILTGNLEPDRGELHININGSRETFEFPKPWWKELNPFDHFTPERLAWEGIGRLWQDLRLFPTMTTLENVAVAALNQKGENPAWALLFPKAKREEVQNTEASSERLKKLGLSERLDSSCNKIAFGQMKRVAIARAIQAGAKVLFLDEPLSGLDKNEIAEVMGYLKDLVKGNSITLVIVEHVYNIPKILKLADTVWTLSNGKLTANKVNEINEEQKTDKLDLHDLLKSIAVEKGRIYSEELPNGARLTTAYPDEYYGSEFALQVKDLVVNRGIRTVINRLSLSLKKGQIAILEAPNGWGKSTLLDAIAGIHPIESGKIMLYGEEITSIPTHKRIKKGLSYLRSQMSVFGSLSVKEHQKLSNARNYLFNSSLNRDSKGSFLSGGEKQKLLIDILPEADVYLLDEPMMGLDEESIFRFKKHFKNLLIKNRTVLIAQPSIN
ncbi:MAG TPA: hypothetical protein DD713_03300 [Nitrospiraceae bacterium]|nr:hypothetical protein [Nitrospiraceae bacterium]